MIKPKPTTPEDPKIAKALADKDQADKERRMKKTGKDVSKPEDTDKLSTEPPALEAVKTP